MDTANTANIASTTTFEDRAPTFPGGGVGARTGPDADGRPASPRSGADPDVCPCHGLPWIVRARRDCKGVLRQCRVKQAEAKARYATSDRGRSRPSRDPESKYKDNHDYFWNGGQWTLFTRRKDEHLVKYARQNAKLLRLAERTPFPEEREAALAKASLLRVKMIKGIK